MVIIKLRVSYLYSVFVNSTIHLRNSIYVCTIVRQCLEVLSLYFEGFEKRLPNRLSSYIKYSCHLNLLPIKIILYCETVLLEMLQIIFSALYLFGFQHIEHSIGNVQTFGNKLL